MNIVHADPRSSWPISKNTEYLNYFLRQFLSILILADTSIVLADTSIVLADTSIVLADTSIVLADTSIVLAD